MIFDSGVHVRAVSFHAQAALEMGNGFIRRSS
jgi:hypothetical protein